MSMLRQRRGLIDGDGDGDGDGYIAITKIGLDNIRMELVLSVDIEDLKLLQHIKNVLKIGRINEYPNISGRRSAIKSKIFCAGAALARPKIFWA